MGAGAGDIGFERLDDGVRLSERHARQIRIVRTATKVTVSLHRGFHSETISVPLPAARHLAGVLIRATFPGPESVSMPPMSADQVRQFRADWAAAARGAAPSLLLISAIRAIVREELAARG